jgi:hypothetical protein
MRSSRKRGGREYRITNNRGTRRYNAKSKINTTTQSITNPKRTRIKRDKGSTIEIPSLYKIIFDLKNVILQLNLCFLDKCGKFNITINNTLAQLEDTIQSIRPSIINFSAANKRLTAAKPLFTSIKKEFMNLRNLQTDYVYINMLKSIELSLHRIDDKQTRDTKDKRYTALINEMNNKINIYLTRVKSVLTSITDIIKDSNYPLNDPIDIKYPVVNTINKYIQNISTLIQSIEYFTNNLLDQSLPIAQPPPQPPPKQRSPPPPIPPRPTSIPKSLQSDAQPHS